MNQSDWPTRSDDLKIVRDIVEKYVDLNDGENLPMLEVLFYGEDRIEYKIPDWLAEMTEVFDDRYGVERGGEVLRHILAQYIVGESVVH